MTPKQTDFPVFVANQVLAHQHLNALADYLDEQGRLSRVLSLGIGIVCGLRLNILEGEAMQLVISPGYGISSEGHAAVLGPDRFIADRVRSYQLPSSENYPLLRQLATSELNAIPLLELMDGTHPDYDSGDKLAKELLQDKCVLLFIERVANQSKNCSPFSCDDKGISTVITLRKLLIDSKIAQQIEQRIHAAVVANGEVYPDWNARLKLPVLRLPRLQLAVANDSNAHGIYQAYRQVLHDELIQTLARSLDALYASVQHLLPTLPQADHLSQQLLKVLGSFPFIQNNQLNIDAQYVYDWIGDLILGYEELRQKAVALIALCNPPQQVFPRHLLLGEIDFGQQEALNLRHHFRPAAGVGHQSQLQADIKLLFQRLQGMLDCFDAAPPQGIEITPSRYGNISLSERALPFYYASKQAPWLRQIWNVAAAGGHPVALSPSYQDRSTELAFNLEPYNFFRIEGHIGLPWRKALAEIELKISSHRLPINVVALNAHPKALASDLEIPAFFSNDLQVIYDIWAKELQTLISDKLNVISHIAIPGTVATPLPPVVDTLPPKVLDAEPMQLAPGTLNFSTARKINVQSGLNVKAGSLGAVFSEQIQNTTPSAATTNTAGFVLSDKVVASLINIPQLSQLTVVEAQLAIRQPAALVGSVIDFADSLPDDFAELDFASLSSRYQAVQKVSGDYLKQLENYQPPAQNPIINASQKNQLMDALQALLSNDLIAKLEELGVEQEWRRQKIEQQSFFSRFLRENPGLEHKAGTVSGGTFVLVYQQAPRTVQLDKPQPGFISHHLDGSLRQTEPAPTKTPVSTAAGLKLSALQQTQLLDALRLQGVNVPTDALSTALKNDLTLEIKPKLLPPEIPQNVVIADFFLPYRCSVEYLPEQLSKPRLTPSRPIIAPDVIVSPPPAPIPAPADTSTAGTNTTPTPGGTTIGGGGGNLGGSDLNPQVKFAPVTGPVIMQPQVVQPVAPVTPVTPVATVKPLPADTIVRQPASGVTANTVKLGGTTTPDLQTKVIK